MYQSQRLANILALQRHSIIVVDDYDATRKCRRPELMLKLKRYPWSLVEVMMEVLPEQHRARCCHWHGA